MATTYNSYITDGSNVNWFDSGQFVDPTINLLGSLARITNSDGTWTVFHGDVFGFTYNSTGGISGTIRWITHTTATADGSFGGATELEAVGGVFEHLDIDFDTWTSGTTTLYDLVFNRTGIVLNGDAGDNVLGGGIFGDIFNGFGGLDTASYRRAAASVTADLAGLVTAQGAASGDVFNSIENLEGSRNGPGDLLLGDSNGNSISGLAGNDTLVGRDGGDTLAGGQGDDVLIGGNGNDTMHGSTGIDELNYNDATSAIFVNLNASGNGTVFTLTQLGTDTYTGIENVRGGTGNDAFQGNQVDNVLAGEDGNDQLDGNDGNDLLFGGLGNDRMTGGRGNDTIGGGGGIDTIAFDRLETGWVKITLVDVGTGTATTQNAGTDTFDGITNVEGSFGDDTIFGNSSGNLLRANEGNDGAQGGQGNDTIDGGAGNDALFGDIDWSFQDGNLAFGDDVVLGGADNDTLYGGNGSDTLVGGSGIDYVNYSGLFDDFGNGSYYIVADLQNNTISKFFFDFIGGESFLVGTDNVTGIGGDASESLVATSGDDTLTDSDQSGVIFGSFGNDTYIPMADGKIDVWYDEDGTDTMDLSRATSAVNIRYFEAYRATGQGGGLGENNFTGAEKLVLTRFSDVVTVTAGSTSGIDTILGMEGNDRIEGGAGGDALDGGSGNDTLSYLVSTSGVNVNLATGVCLGGDAQGDTIISFERILGSAFDDRLIGNNQRNTFTGGVGRDVLRGGGNSDTFAYTSIADSTVSAAGRDSILDFNANAVDIVDLSAIDAISDGGLANDVFSYLGTAAFTAAGQVRYVQVNGNTFIEINVNSGLAADMRIMLSGLVDLDAADFRL